MSEPDYQRMLRKRGVVVVPTPLADAEARLEARRGFFTLLAESPEFRSSTRPSSTDTIDTIDPAWQPVKGGFAALAHPTSYHHLFSRELREQMHAHMLDMDVLPMRYHKYLEQCFDRLMFRQPGQTPKEELLHRDEAKTAHPNDLIFGGWVNLDDSDQHFSCVPETHTEVSGNRGFAKIDDPLEKAKYKERLESVRIPPGHLLVFYERIVHEVLANTAPKLTMRMFFGWRLTNETSPLFGKEALSEWIQDQAVPKIKSGQDPVVWPSSYSNFSRNFQPLTDWSKETWIPELLYTHTVSAKASANSMPGSQWERVPARLPSLQKLSERLGRHVKHRGYCKAELAVLKPNNRWRLRTFKSPNKRVEFVAVDADSWKAYEAACEQIRGMRTIAKREKKREKARRPRPERLNEVNC